jgi:hypothetical protein
MSLNKRQLPILDRMEVSVGIEEITSKPAILRAIQEYDEIGEEDFCTKYGFGRSRNHWLFYKGRRYVSKAILGAAYGYQFPSRGPLDAYGLMGGQPTIRKLQMLGFQMVSGSSGDEIASALDPTAADDEPFNPANATDARDAVERAIKVRRGQQFFRSSLLRAYTQSCAITGCKVLAVLEAAHITPYLGPETNHITNGILLRSDLHTLWDSHLVYINPKTFHVVVHSSLRSSEYGSFHNRPCNSPKREDRKPSILALKQHMESCNFEP